ncbi:Radical SAM superfamily enzyme [Candidatus Methanomarinus sp.]|nr:Radical SAM superfamily enzyme [ANME-2 cluster archaeon]
MKEYEFRGACWIITTKCNMNCPICLRYLGRDSVDINRKKTIVDRLSFYGFKAVSFSGGEPFLDNDLLQIVRYAKEKGLYVGISKRTPINNRYFGTSELSP